jgi:Secretion system C-terminal sorting domain/Lamin Tail Domain
MKKILLAIASLGVASLANAQCTELFMSEVVEGSSHNKAIEIYNPTPAPVNMSNYRIVRYSNGATSGFDSLDLTGTIAAHAAFVVVNGQAVPDGNGAFCDSALIALGDQVGQANYPGPLYFNGDDALVLVRISPYAIIDIFGKIGEDPGQSWSDVFPYTDAQGSWWTKDHSLVRKSAVTAGVVVNPTAFNVIAEYDSLPENDWSNLGIHNSTCSTSGIFENGNATTIGAYPNPSNGNVTITATENITIITVMNVLGETVSTISYSKSEQNKQQQLNLIGLPAGIYLVEAKLANGQRATTKLTIQ